MEQIIEPVAPTAADLTAAGLHIIGTLYEPMTDPEAAPVALDGYHINSPLRVEGWDSFLVTPVTPRAVFAGHKTYCYTFADEAAALTAYGDGITMLPEPVVPTSVTRKQARQALLLAGVLSSVQPAIDAIQDPLQQGMVQIAWDDALEFQRTDPTLLALASALGMNDEALDQLFVTAGGL